MCTPSSPSPSEVPRSRARDLPRSGGSGSVRVVTPPRVLTPIHRRLGPRRVLDDAGDGADGRGALASAVGQLRQDDDVDPRMTDRAEMWRAVPHESLSVGAASH